MALVLGGADDLGIDRHVIGHQRVGADSFLEAEILGRVPGVDRTDGTPAGPRWHYRLRRWPRAGSPVVGDPWQPKAQKWAISISSLQAKPKRSPAAQWQHIQNQGHGRMRLILN